MLKKIIGGLLMAASALVILALLNVNYLVQRNKSYLLAKAGNLLGCNIAAKRIDVTLWPISARLEDVAISDKPAVDNNEDWLRAKAMQVDLQFLPLLTGRFQAQKTALDSPVIVILRADNERNDNNEASRHCLKQRARNVKNPPPTNQNRDTELFFIFAPLNISDGTLRYRDGLSGGEITVSQISLKIIGSNLDEPLEVELEAAVMAGKTNFRLNGRFGPMAEVRDYRDVPIDGNLQVDALDMGKVNGAMPGLKKGLPKVLQFDGVYSTQDLKFKGSLNNLSLKGAITGTDASARFE